MFFEKSEKTLLVISSIVYIAYVVFIGGMISIFKEYVGNEYLRTKIVDQIREQTRLTQDSANVSTKDMHFIFQVMGQLAWPYFALLIVLFLLLVYVLFKKDINHNVVAFLLLVYSILLLIFSLGILFISQYQSLKPTLGALPGIKAFVAAVLGGIGSIPGAMLGGILLGIIESVSKAYISTELADAIVFGVLVIVLLVRPSGLLGKKKFVKV